VVEADEAIAAVADQVGVGGKQLRGARARDLGAPVRGRQWHEDRRRRHRPVLGYGARTALSA
jgi:hypothetical protein